MCVEAKIEATTERECVSQEVAVCEFGRGCVGILGQVER